MDTRDFSRSHARRGNVAGHADARDAERPGPAFPRRAWERPEQEKITLKYWYPCRLLLSLLLMLTSVTGCLFLPKLYSSEPIEAQVVAADTGQPVEGVNVVADWILHTGGFERRLVGHANLLETLTDAQGRFSLPAWQYQWVSTGRVDARSPLLILFKSGYPVEELQNNYSNRTKHAARWVLYSDWHGQTIKLKPFHGSLQEYAQHLTSLDSSLDFIIERNCGWRYIPRLLMALTKQNQTFKANGIKTLLSSALDSDGYFAANEYLIERECGSYQELFRSYQP